MNFLLRDFEKRLRKLESVLPALPPAEACWIDGVLWFSVAYYLGRPLQDEQPLAAFARALRYADEVELNRALASDDWVVRGRFDSAQLRLYEMFEWDPMIQTEENAEKLAETLKGMEAGLSSSYKERLKTILKRTDINLSWIARHGDLASYLGCFA